MCDARHDESFAALEGYKQESKKHEHDNTEISMVKQDTRVIHQTSFTH